VHDEGRPSRNGATSESARDVRDVTRQCGSLERWLADPRIKEVMVNDGRDVFVEDDDGLRRVANLTPGETAAIIQRILLPHGKRADRTSPIVDTRLVDGSRVCIVVPPASRGPCVSIRRFTLANASLADFGDGQCTSALERLVDERRNIVVTGAASTGKTTLLNALTSRISADQRVVVIEDVAELSVRLHNVVRLEAQPPGTEGAGELSMQTLLRAALRMRPDRLVVGEVRGAEVADLLEALDTGHAGSLGTCHATSGTDALDRLALLVLRHHPQWGSTVARAVVHRVIDAVVHLERDDTGARHVAHIVSVPNDPGHRVRMLYRRGVPST
jgi:pilus assembly protein CpaF